MTVLELLNLAATIVDIILALRAFYRSFIYPAYLVAMDVVTHFFWQGSTGLLGWALTLLITLSLFGYLAYRSTGTVCFPAKVVASTFHFSFLVGFACSGTAHCLQDGLLML